MPAVSQVAEILFTVRFKCYSSSIHPTFKWISRTVGVGCVWVMLFTEERAIHFQAIIITVVPQQQNPEQVHQLDQVWIKKKKRAWTNAVRVLVHRTVRPPYNAVRASPQFLETNANTLLQTVSQPLPSIFSLVRRAAVLRSDDVQSHTHWDSRYINQPTRCFTKLLLSINFIHSHTNKMLVLQLYLVELVHVNLKSEESLIGHVECYRHLTEIVG